jgi:hypothetical protein
MVRTETASVMAGSSFSMERKTAPSVILRAKSDFLFLQHRYCGTIIY